MKSIKTPKTINLIIKHIKRIELNQQRIKSVVNNPNTTFRKELAKPTLNYKEAKSN